MSRQDTIFRDKKGRTIEKTGAPIGNGLTLFTYSTNGRSLTNEELKKACKTGVIEMNTTSGLVCKTGK